MGEVLSLAGFKGSTTLKLCYLIYKRVLPVLMIAFNPFQSLNPHILDYLLKISLY